MANRIEFETFVSPAGFRKGLAEMEAAANATNGRLQNMLRSKISGVESRMAGMAPDSWEYVQAAQRKARLERSLLNVQNAMFLRAAQDRQAITKKEQDAEMMVYAAGQQEWRKIQEAKTAAMLAGFEMQRIAGKALEAEQLASLMNIARGHGAGISSGGAHGGGGFAGIIRESLVIVREISMGRGMGRTGGSISLLAQYLGLLGKVVHSTATEALMASAAATKLAQSMALEAAQARGTAGFQALASAALKQEAVAAEKATQAEIALLNAKVRLNAIGWGAIGAGVLIIALFSIWKHLSTINKEEKAFQELTDATRKKFTDEAEAARADAKAHEELQRWLRDELENRRELIDVTDERIRQLHEEMEAQRELARAKGESAEQINAMEIQELKNEEAILKTTLKQAKADMEKAQARLQAADTNYTTNPSGAAASGMIDLRGAQTAEKSSGEVLDAIQQYIKDNPEIITSIGAGSVIGGLSPIAPVGAGTRPINENDNIVVKIGGKTIRTTLAQAQAAYENNKRYVDELTKIQGALADELDAAKGDIKASNAAIKKFSVRLKELQDQIAIKQGIGAKAASAEDAKKFSKEWGNSGTLVNVGNFLGTARSGIESLAHKHMRIAEDSLRHLRSIDGKTRSAHDHGAGPVYSGS